MPDRGLDWKIVGVRGFGVGLVVAINFSSELLKPQ